MEEREEALEERAQQLVVQAERLGHVRKRLTFALSFAALQRGASAGGGSGGSGGGGLGGSKTHGLSAVGQSLHGLDFLGGHVVLQGVLTASPAVRRAADQGGEWLRGPLAGALLFS